MSADRSMQELQIAAMFDRIAGRYDFLNRLLSARQDVRWRRNFIKGLPGGARDYLDVATGTGDVVLELFRQRPETSSVWAVDLSSAMVSLARRKLGAFLSRNQVRVEVMSATSLDLQDRSFDVVTIAFGLRNVPDRRRALEEFHRVLRPGGCLAILEFFPPERSLLAALFRFYFKSILPWIGGLLSNPEAYRYLPRSVETFGTFGGLLEETQAVGFTGPRERSFLAGSTRILMVFKNH